MLQFNQSACPTCGEPPAGTLETLSGLAELVQTDEGFEYGGTIRIHWHSQRTVQQDRRMLLECSAGHHWWSAWHER